MESETRPTSVVVLGTAVLDNNYTVDELPGPEDSSVVTSLHRSFGGRGVIPAVTLARLGAAVTLFAALGADYASSGFAQYLAEARVNTTLATRHERERLYTANIYKDARSRHYTFFHARDLALTFTSAHSDVVTGSAYLYVAFNGAFQFDRECVLTAWRCGVPIIVNLCNAILRHSGEDFVRDLIMRAEVLSLNHVEWEMLRALADVRHPRDIFKLGPKLCCVYITRGAAPGTGLLRDGEPFDIPIRRLPVMGNPVGAGDTFLAGVVWAIAQGWSYEVAALSGSVLASCKVASNRGILEEDEIADARTMMRAAAEGSLDWDSAEG